MVSLAWRDILASKGRLAASVGGVAFSVVLVLFMVGIYNGFMAASVNYINGAGADVWVTTEGSSDIYAGTGLPEDLEARIRSVAGVTAVAPIYTRLFHGDLFDTGTDRLARQVETGDEVDVFVIGFDPATGLGGPAGVVAGTLAIEGREVVIDRALAEEQGLGVGDTIRLFDEDWVVAGISGDAQVAFVSYAFIDHQQARDDFHLRGLASFFVVKVREGADPGEVAAAIEDRVRGVTALSTADFGDRNSQPVREVFVPILLSITAIGLGTAMAVVTVTTWSAVNERLVEYGVLKAIGAGAGVLYRVVVAQSGFSALAGFVVGVPAYLATAYAMTTLVPRIPVVTDWGLVAGLLGLVLLMGLASCYLPLRKVASVDPAEVFRGGW